MAMKIAPAPSSRQSRGHPEPRADPEYSHSNTSPRRRFPSVGVSATGVWASSPIDGGSHSSSRSVMSETEAAELRGRLDAFERRTGGPLKGDLRHKSHLLFTWLAKLVRRSSILDTVEDLHGPDLLCWTTNFFIKEAADPAFVSWHQDS